ncbi:ABC transporter permease [Salipiger sp. P9]|uniref:ABC transporter permease n=1 Tax=Salipiger pentaromativorans TaxID=2943193 RepID=UPI002157DDA8|nr:ABC transporter permease [Salipiger pentaromativorans]MCR8546917.1 ABC transporter permease [Salipiger pentaromativorans]
MSEAATAPAALTSDDAAPRRTGPNALAWLILPIALLFALFFVLPISLMLLMSVLTGNPMFEQGVRFTPENYIRFASDSYNWEVLWITIRIGLSTTLAALLLGYPLAHLMARVHSRTGHALLLIAVLAPMLTGIVVRTFAWMAILSDTGVVNATLMRFGLIDRPLPLLNSETGIVIGLTHIYIPYMVLTLNGVISRIDERLEQAATNLGAHPLRAFWEVTLPLSVPGILAGSLLVFALSISAYVTPLLMGGFQFMTLPLLIYQQISASFNIGFAAALGIILLVISLALVIGYNRVLGLLSGDRDLT